MGIFKSLNNYVSKFTSTYLSTSVIFIFDMIMSLIASLVMLGVVEVFLYSGTFHWKLVAYWMGLSFLFSFIFIWRLRTYGIIVRHMTITEMALFALVAFSKVAATSVVFGLTFRFAPLLYFMAIADFFFTFGMFFILRLSMLYAYNIIKARKDLLQKYNFDLQSIQTVEDVEPFLQTIKENEPSLYPYRSLWSTSPWTRNSMME